MVGSTMWLSVYMPHSCRDEGDYIEALDTVRATLTEGKKVRLGNTGEEDLHGLDSIDWYGL